MKINIQLDESDIVDIIAEKFDTTSDNITLKIEKVYDGYGQDAQKLRNIVANIHKEEKVVK